ncbi:MAG: tetratricopeptide repeat protein [Sphingomonas sp.]
MAVPPNTNEAFLREVDEELRRDELIGVWQRYGKLIAAAVVLALAAFGGWLYYQHWSADKANAQGEQLVAAYGKLGSGDVAGAGASLADLSQSRAAGYRALAKLTQADLLLKKNDLKGGAAKYAEVAGDTSLAQPFRDFALVRQTAAEFDALKPQVVIDRLRSLAVKGNPWFGSAGEMVAIAYLQSGRPQIAQTLFSQIAADPGVPDTIHRRASDMAASLAAGAAPEKKAP